MGPVILHIWGPFAIQSYGFFIAVGAITFITLIQRDKRFAKLGLQTRFNTLFLLGAAAVLVGGRALHVMRHYDAYDSWIEWFALWEPGFAVLGSTVAVACVVPLYIYSCKIPMLPLLDLLATYIPLLQSIARLGCFFAGCCFGCEAFVPWSVIYTNSASLAPLNTYLHPAQLYSSAFLFLLFIFMYCGARRWCKIPGQQSMLYLMFASTERFITDFWRGDREMVFENISLSFHQFLALGLIACGMIGYALFTYRGTRSQKAIKI